MNTLELLDAIEKKTRRLKQHNERLQADNKALEARIFDYLQQIEQSKAEIKLLKETIHTRAIGQELANHQTLRKELDRYINIIDQCMASIATQESQ